MTKMTNSFWREVIDQLPGIFLLFRIDEKEEAHLIFANGNILNTLGYAPEEFVLASESEGSVVSNGVTDLVDKIAKLSHSKNRSYDGPDRKSDIGGRSSSFSSASQRGGSESETPRCRFYSKRAAECEFYFDFRIFSVKTTPHPFIAVSLKPVSELEAGPGVKMGQKSEHPLFIVQSPLMKKLMKKVDTVTGQQGHLLFRGEPGTGKRTIAAQVLQGEALSGATCLEWNLPEWTPSARNAAVEKLCGDAGRTDETMEQADKLTLLVVDIGKLTLTNQNKLFNWMQVRTRTGKQTRVLAVSGVLLEELMQQGKFSVEFYYYLGFDTILLPPLSQRKEDIRHLGEIWLPGVAENLGLGRIEVSDQVMEELLQHDWPGNFHEFFRVMRKSLPASEKGNFRLIMDSDTDESQTRRAANGVDPGLQEIVRFDEMNRRYLEKVLKKTEGKIYGKDGAARLLGMKPTTLQSKLKKLGVR